MGGNNWIHRSTCFNNQLAQQSGQRHGGTGSGEFLTLLADVCVCVRVRVAVVCTPHLRMGTPWKFHAPKGSPVEDGNQKVVTERGEKSGTLLPGF